MESIKYLCKLTGLILVVMGTAGAGLCLIKERRDGLFFTEKTLQMLMRIRHMAVYEKRTLEEACECLAEDEGLPYKDCFCRIVKRMQTHDGKHFGAIWEEEFRKEVRDVPFTEEEAERLAKIPSCMMAADPSRTAQMLDDAVCFFEERAKRRKEQAGEREKVILSVCMMAGVLIGILFW